MLVNTVKLTDDVYPLNFLDDSVLNRMLVNWIIHFNDVLDPEKLHWALDRLLHIGDYRKLGGRLRTRSKGKLEVHVPRQYTRDRPSFLFHHDNHNIPLAQHRLAPYLGETTNVPCLQPYSVELSCFIFGTGVPQTFNGRVDTDVPVMSIHLSSFTDATLMGVSWPHALMDGSGFHAMWRGWSLVLAGRENDLPPVLDTNAGVLEQAVTAHIQNKNRLTSAMEQWRLRGWKMIAWILRFIWSVIRNNGVTVRRIFIPKAAVGRLRARATQDLAQTAHKGEFVSENSVMTAWYARIISMVEQNARPLTLISFLDARHRLRQVQKGGVYIQNMILPWFMFIPKSLFGATVGEIALSIQTQAKERSTEHEALSWLETFHKAYHTGASPIFSMLVGESDAMPIGINNLDKFGFIQAIEFGPAVIPAFNKDETDRVNPSGTPTRITIHEKPERSGTFVYITGKDYGQNYCALARMKPKQWNALEKELNELATRISSKM